MTYTNYGNASFSSYVFAFTITYLSTPMFTNKANNWWLFSGLLLYFAFDIFIKYYNGCVTNGAELFIKDGSDSNIRVFKMKYGDFVVFPSKCEHRVNMLREGNRYSLVVWYGHKVLAF